MRKIEQRDLERAHFQLLRAGVENFPRGFVVHEDSPDFLVEGEKGPIGVEHSLLLKAEPTLSPNSRAVEVMRDAILSEAYELYQLQAAPPAFVYVFFRDGVRISKDRSRTCAVEITRLCVELAGETGTRSEIRRGDPNDGRLPVEVDELCLQRVESWSSGWSCPEMGMVVEDARELLQRRILKKAVKIPLYRERCKECWLLLVAENLGSSSFIDPDESTLMHRFESPFRRVFFLDASTGKVCELQTKPAVS